MRKAKYETDRTRLKTVRGMVFSADGRFGTTNIDVRMTVDKAGASMSLALGELIMLQIPMEAVSDMVKVVQGK